MKVLFLTIGQIGSLKNTSVHLDIIKALKAAGHSVSVLCTLEKRLGLDTKLTEEENVKILRLRIGNITRCSIIEKGISTIRIEGQFKRALKKYFKKDDFDLIIYNTPPITFASAIKYAKKKYGCKSYLMLKDIFPQNAVDLNVLSKTGLKGLLYKYFREKEKQLYKVSDRIGCMSEANKKYLLKNNKYISESIVEIFPNSVYSCEDKKTVGDRSDATEILKKMGIDSEKVTFIYGGNLGKPQGLDFLAKGVIEAAKIWDFNFVIIGDGTEKKRIFEKLKGQKNVFAMEALPSDEYDLLCSACDVGVIALDYRFTIPNYPSRILSYMKNAKPIFAVTDKNTDLKELVESEARCGKWCYSDDCAAFVDTLGWFVSNRDKLDEMGKNGKKYLKEHFTTDINVELLEKFVNN